jgi:hypothetical protein
MTTTIERLVEIENERQETMNNPNFHRWMKELDVSVIYKDNEPIHRAKEMNSEYNFKKLLVKQNIFRIFSI